MGGRGAALPRRGLDVLLDRLTHDGATREGDAQGALLLASRRAPPTPSLRIHDGISFLTTPGAAVFDAGLARVVVGKG